MIYGDVLSGFSLGLVMTYTAGRIDRVTTSVGVRRHGVTTFVGAQIDRVTTVI